MNSTNYVALLSAAVAAGAMAGHAMAQEQGRVLSTTPVIHQVAVPRQVCSNEQVTTSSPQKSGAGALVGAIAGGAVGNAAGNGSGRAAMTALGLFGGAILGDKIEGGQQQASTQNVQRCSTQTVYENKPVAYNVVYEFNGKQYQVQLPQDPGPFVSLQVTPVGGQPVQPTPMPAPAPVIVRPQTQAPVYVQPVILESYTTYVQPARVYVRPAPIFVQAAPVVYAPRYQTRPYPHQRHGPHYGTSVSIGYTGYSR